MAAAPPVRMQSAQVVLRKVEPADDTALFAAASDPEVVRFMDWPKVLHLADVSARLQQADARWSSGEEYQWAIVDPQSGDVVGTISCRRRGHAVDFGYFLRRSAWGQGLASAAAGLVVSWLRSEPSVRRIWATTDARNERSIRILERLGLEREGLLRKATIRPNIGPDPRDTVLYAWVRPG